MAIVSVIGRRWFRRSYGNTYSAATVIVDGKAHETGPHGGYGDYYQQLACELLQREYPQLQATYPLWRWAQENGHTYTYQAIDVPRERDL